MTAVQKSKPMQDIDYVEFYAKELSGNNKLFEQQKKLIESQLKGSSSLFKKTFSNKNFKLNARRYLRKVGLLK